MRDLVFKNLTSEDKKRRIIATSEVFDQQGVRNIIHRHFVCVVREIKDTHIQRPLPYLYVLKERNTQEQRERFFCRIKGSMYAVCNGRLYLVRFMHSLKVNIIALPQDLVQYNEEV